MIIPLQKPKQYDPPSIEYFSELINPGLNGKHSRQRLETRFRELNTRIEDQMGIIGSLVSDGFNESGFFYGNGVSPQERAKEFIYGLNEVIRTLGYEVEQGKIHKAQKSKELRELVTQAQDGLQQLRDITFYRHNQIDLTKSDNFTSLKQPEKDRIETISNRNQIVDEIYRIATNNGIVSKIGQVAVITDNQGTRVNQNIEIYKTIPSRLLAIRSKVERLRDTPLSLKDVDKLGIAMEVLTRDSRFKSQDEKARTNLEELCQKNFKGYSHHFTTSISSLSSSRFFVRARPDEPEKRTLVGYCQEHFSSEIPSPIKDTTS